MLEDPFAKGQKIYIFMYVCGCVSLALYVVGQSSYLLIALMLLAFPFKK